MDLEGRVAIVTGASRGIGRQIAIALGTRGVRVVVAARTVEAHRRLPGTIGETVATIEAAGGDAEAVQVDVTRAEDLEHLVAVAVDRFGGLDLLVNNAADTRGANAPVEEYPWDSWAAQFDANVHGPFRLIGLAVPHLKGRGGGAIVNITSGAAEPVTLPTPQQRSNADGSPGLGTLIGYATTKAALNRMTNALAVELAPAGIAVVAVDPGFTRTELVDLMGERGLVDPEGAAPMSLTVDTVLEVITAPDRLRYSGQVVRAQERNGTTGSGGVGG